MNVLIVGGGAREHALTWKALQSPLTDTVFCAPGNAATGAIAINTGLQPTDAENIARFVNERDVGLTVIGPEVAVAAGLADRLTAAGRLVFGPTQAAGRIESSKAFAKSLMERARVPTPGYRVFDNPGSAKDFVRGERRAFVVKADGLAKGKGTLVARDAEETLECIDTLLLRRTVGAAADRIVLEEKIDGREVSLMAFVDGERIVPLAPAGTVDIMARLLGQWLSDRLGQQFIIENRSGASTNLGTEAVVRASPDGYTLLMIDVSAAVNVTLYDKLSFNFIRDIAPVANVVRVPNVIAVHPSFPAKTVPEFIAHAKANPGKISMATGGVGSSSHVFGELFKMMAGVNLVAVPYRGGGPALIDMLSGQVDVIFVPTAASIEYVRAGRLRALAVTSTTRIDALPDLPPVADFVPGYEASSWYGIGAPRNTPAEIIDRLNKEINAGLAEPKIKARFADIGGTALPGSPADFAKVIAEDTEKWGKVIRTAHIKPE